jgi:hypothetical protein
MHQVLWVADDEYLAPRHDSTIEESCSSSMLWHSMVLQLFCPVSLIVKDTDF